MKTALRTFALLAALATSARANLVSHWSFDTANGSIVADAQDNFNGTLSGTTPYVAGLFGQALSFDSSLGSYVSLGADPALNWVGAAFSFSLWLKTTTTTPSTFLFTKHATGSGNGYVGALNPHNSNTMGDADSPSFYLSGNEIVAPSATVNDGLWHHLAFTYEAGGAAAIYVDGAQVVFTGTAPALSSNGEPLYLGALSYFGAPPTASYTGLLDEVRMYNHALSAGEVTALAAVPEPASSAALAGAALLGLAAARRRRRA